MASEHRLNRRKLIASCSGAAAAAFLAAQGVTNAAPEKKAGFAQAPAHVTDQEMQLLIRNVIQSAYGADAAV